jgi:hypothetical protein
MTKELTPWQKFFNKDFIGSHSLDEGEELILTIKQAKEQRVTKPGGKQDNCLVLHFSEDVKPMVLNVTNSKAVQKITGSRFIEKWAGHKVCIYVDDHVKFAGEFVEGLRIKAPAKAAKETKENLTRDAVITKMQELEPEAKAKVRDFLNANWKSSATLRSDMAAKYEAGELTATYIENYVDNAVA